MGDDFKDWNKLTDKEKSDQLNADLERMRAGGKTDIRGRPDLVDQGPVLSAIIHEELRSNPEALKTLEALKAAGVDGPTAVMGKAMYCCMYEVARGMPERWPQVVIALREGRTLEELFPDALYTDPSGQAS
jgi:hypothetical protein